MNKILSWKIGNGVYAYVYPVNNDNTHVAKKIPENSPLWDNIISEISTWDRNKYTSNFDKMAKEVKEKYAIEIPRDIDKYWGFTSGGSNVNIVLLSGDDGSSGNGNSNDSNDSSENITTEDINEILDRIKDEAYARQSAITQYVLTEANKTITDAKNEISDVKEHLDNIKEELGGKLSAATDAINATKKLFDDGDITPEKINDALSTISEHGEWVTASSGFITSIRNGADEATQQIGGIADAEDPVRGYFSTIASNINALSGTVGTVTQTVDASKGKIEDMASWYDTNASAATNAINYINASAGTIGSSLEYINGSGLTTYLNREMDAHAMTIKDTIESDFEDSITSVNRMLDGFSGVIKDTVVKYNETEGKLTSLGDEMDATNRRMAKYMNITDDTQREVMDFRETWTEASGMLRTVGKLIYEEDADGNATGKVFPAKDIGEKYENYKQYAEQDVILKKGEDVWRLKASGDTIIPDLIVIPNLSQVLGSFISQTASEVAFGVANDSGTIAEISAKISGNTSFINLISDKVQISGQLIAQSLSSNTADIGGIIIGSGQVKTSGNTVVINGNDGSLTAKKGTIGGIKINESSLSANSFSVTSAGVITANDIIINGGKLFGNNVEEDKLIFKDKDGNTVLYIGSVDKNEGEEKDPVICGGFKDKKMSVSKFTYTDNSSSQTVYATFIQPPSFADIFLKVNVTEIENEGYFHKGNGTILYYDTNNKIKYCEEKDKYSIGLLELSNGSKELCVIQETTDANWGSTVYKVFKQKEGDETCKINVDDFASFKDKIDFADLLIYDDGSIESDYVTFNNGLFKGEIDSDGIFKGNLNEVNGSINNVTINNSLINNSLINNLLYVDEVLNVKNDYDNIFNTQYFSNDYSFYDQNKTKKIVTFSNSNEIVLFNKQNVTGENVEVEIEEISGFIHRFIPFNREADSASVTVTISGLNNIKFGNDNKQSDGIFTYTQPKLTSRGKTRNEFKTTKIKGTLPAPGYLKITLSYNIPAARKYGASYGSAWVSVNKMRIFFDTKSKGLSINRNGFSYNSQNGKNGIKITDEGIFFYLDNTEYNLKTLIGI
jgi:hypothetical protein